MKVESTRLRIIELTTRQMQLLLDDYQALEETLGLPQTTQQLARRLRPVIAHNISFVQNAPQYHTWYTYWVLVLKAEDRIVGGLGFKGPPDERGEVEIGYGMDDAERNKGYMTEAVAAMVRWALAQPDVASVRAETANTNVASMRVLQKVGFIAYRATDRYLYWRFKAGQLSPAQKAEDNTGHISLYDLVVTVESIDGHCTCDMQVGDRFYLTRSSSLRLPDGRPFCIWALNSVLPFLSAKQRRNHPADWIETDSHVACPDPACGLIMRIDRLGESRLHHDDVSPIPWDSIHP